MRVLDIAAAQADPIREHGSRYASALAVADGTGEAHVYCLYLKPGGQIGPHPAGFGQLLVVLEGRGWVAGADAARVPLQGGQMAVIERGEVHSKGSDSGMTALMVQVSDLRVQAAA